VGQVESFAELLVNVGHRIFLQLDSYHHCAVVRSPQMDGTGLSGMAHSPILLRSAVGARR
jgi:hypothetical protein